MAPKVQAIKENMDELDIIKFLKLLYFKEHYQMYEKNNPQNGTKSWKSHV
jgi:hypothetical protein